VLAVEGVLSVEAQLMGVDGGNRNGFRPVGRDAPHPRQVGVEDVSGAVLDDADAGMRDGRGAEDRDEQDEEEPAHDRGRVRRITARRAALLP
jgi:hypothetical protein